VPTGTPTSPPFISPTNIPTSQPQNFPTTFPTDQPVLYPTSSPSESPTGLPSANPIFLPTSMPTEIPSCNPVRSPAQPSSIPTSFQPSLLSPNVNITCSSMKTASFLNLYKKELSLGKAVAKAKSNDANLPQPIGLALDEWSRNLYFVDYTLNSVFQFNIITQNVILLAKGKS
jgi:hypothetical protein